jgi:dTDP-glucose pyrophosphorylase
MWGIVPSAGVGSRIQPLACSKELLPVGRRHDGDSERPRALSDYIVDRMLAAGVTRFCFVVAPGKTDILRHYGALAGGRPTSYVVQETPAGLCDAVFRALPFIRPEEQVVVGLPDTLFYPEHALRLLPDGGLTFLCFPVAEPEGFEVVLSADDGDVREVRDYLEDESGPGARWVWGAFKLDGATLRALYDVWCERGREDTSIGAVVSAWLARGGAARAVRAGEVFLDVDNVDAFHEALKLAGGS